MTLRDLYNHHSVFKTFGSLPYVKTNPGQFQEGKHGRFQLEYWGINSEMRINMVLVLMLIQVKGLKYFFSGSQAKNSVNLKPAFLTKIEA